MSNLTTQAHLLTGLARRYETPRWALIYGAIGAISLSGVAMAHTFCFTTFCALLATTYLTSQALFLLIHLTLHRQFIEMQWRKLSVGPLFAQAHHYAESYEDGIFAKGWLLYRLSYFVTVDLEGRAMWSGAVAVHALYLLMCLVCLGPSRLAWTTWSLYIGAHHLQAIVHEWYHVRRKRRARHFVFWLRGLMEMLETIGLISTSRHRRHHVHNHKTKEAVVAFFDIRAPPGCDWAAEALHRLLGRATTRGWSSHLICQRIGTPLYLAVAWAGLKCLLLVSTQ